MSNPIILDSQTKTQKHTPTDRQTDRVTVKAKKGSVSLSCRLNSFRLFVINFMSRFNRDNALDIYFKYFLVSSKLQNPLF